MCVCVCVCVCVLNSWSCLKLSGFVYVNVEVFSTFIFERFLKVITEVKS